MNKKYKKTKLVIGILLGFIGLTVIYWNIPYSPHKSSFDKKMSDYANKVQSTKDTVSIEEIEKLPVALQRYCDYIGIEKFPKHSVVRAYFEDTDFVFDDKSQKILKMDYDLWLFYDKWYRSAFCQSHMYGVPFEGADYCTEEKEGGMKGFLGKAIPIFDVCTRQGYQAGLISWFAESLTINPIVLFSELVSYEQIDDSTVKVTICDNEVKGEGLIYFNQEGAITEFYSDDRQVEEIDGKMTKIGWRCEYENYQERNGIKQAKTVRGIKVYPDKEIVYFAGDNYEVTYSK